jgi:hypothetical protein
MWKTSALAIAVLQKSYFQASRLVGGQKGVMAKVRDAPEQNDSRAWLLILDEADDKAIFKGPPGRICLMSYMPMAKHRQIMITTRDSRVVGRADG